jgi:hypothetical protein
MSPNTLLTCGFLIVTIVGHGLFFSESKERLRALDRTDWMDSILNKVAFPVNISSMALAMHSN